MNVLFTVSGAWGSEGGGGLGSSPPVYYKGIQNYVSLKTFLPEYYTKDGSLVDVEELITNQAYFTSVLCPRRLSNHREIANH